MLNPAFYIIFGFELTPQSFTCLKSSIKALEKGVKCVHS